MKKRMETSKKLAWASIICFVATIIYGIVIFTYSIIYDKVFDAGLLVTMVTVTGAAFATTTAFYYNKSRYENLIKLQQSFLKTKYLILKDVQMLDEYRVQTELDTELSKIESNMENESMITNQEITYNG